MGISDKVALIGAVALLKLFVTQSIYVIYVSAGELLPTPIRSSGMGAMAVGGLIGSIFAPYVVSVSNICFRSQLFFTHLTYISSEVLQALVDQLLVIWGIARNLDLKIELLNTSYMK